VNSLDVGSTLDLG